MILTETFFYDRLKKPLDLRHSDTFQVEKILNCKNIHFKGEDKLIMPVMHYRIYQLGLPQRHGGKAI